MRIQRKFFLSDLRNPAADRPNAIGNHGIVKASFAMREPIGLKDRDGIDIKEGDIVEFAVEYDHLERPTYDSPNATPMRDTARIMEGSAYFVNEYGWAGFAWRHAEHCRVVGSIYGTKKPAPLSQDGLL